MFQVQPAQHVYPSQVQYVEGGDAIYANGALYVPSSPLQTAPGHARASRPARPTPASGDVFAQTPLLAPGRYAASMTRAFGPQGPAEISEITCLCSFYF